MDMLTVAKFCLGLAGLIAGAEFLVRGASGLAAAFGVSRIAIGLTVVAWGTGSPEAAVCVQAGLSNHADISLGNVVGSNICNVLLVLGLSAAIAPLAVSREIVRRDVPLMIGASFLLFVLAANGTLGRLDGLVMAAAIAAYTVYSLVHSRRTRARAREITESEGDGESPPWKRHWAVCLGLVALGLGMLVAGADWLVEGAVTVARLFHVSELIIALTLVAGGTSLPEVATSAVASIRGERDIAVGNVIGSNLFNILAVLGATAATAPLGITVAPSVLRFDLPVMIATALACLPVFFTGKVISRWEGALFLGYYVAYLLYLFLKATDHDAQPVFSAAMLWFVVPITAVTLLVLAAGTYLRGRSAAP